ncbi:penicillin-binding protein 1B [Crocosphaera subtropica ATCC 51142]|uniref:Penicillin-binding protein 1B n=1 Tax=Crocosphaera subtropica (strain ATCC 51142 / BH68) TaxID=43989 RepID=B1WRQ4_CROS5|nr:PBP1A family penicillin-binding protein [Crocosphaera subtropica]ACB53495.1 penicillin-binding protein 1B [Crocosphaera subtropica ATCC 51142]
MSQQQPLSQLLTQAVQNLVKSNPKTQVLKKGAKVPEIRVKESPKEKLITYALIGDRYIIGRSSRHTDIKILHPIVSQVHCSLHRDQKNPRHFIIKDENSTNGVYLGKRRVKNLSLRHGDTLTFGPPELKDLATLTYHNPPPKWMQWLRYGFYGTGSLITLLIAWLLWETSKITVRPLPSGVSGPVVVYARDGETPLSPLSDDPHHEIDRLKDFSPHLTQAVIASEDSRFYWHFGVDPYGILRAMVVNLKDDGIRQGASTLTQQLARSLFPEVGRENTAQRKIREMIVALKLEAVYSKDFLLKTYLNRVYLGVGNYGFEDAAQFYFDKSATELDIAEAATLVAMLPAPNLYNPVQDYDTSVQLRNRVIDRMATLRMISPEEAARARRSRINISPEARKALANSKAPYFYAHVFQELRQLLGTEIAKEGNFIVETGLDLNRQALAEKKLLEAVKTQGATYGFSNGAMVTLDTRTGEILALVGGTDYKQSQFNRVTQAKRQPGSTFKLFAYAAALEKGISPGKSYSCGGIRWQGQAYKPCERSSGATDMYGGMAQSENTIALQVAREAGLNRVVDVAQRLGVHSELQAVPGLILGQSEVSVLEMTGAYAAVANDGLWQRPHAIRRILDGGDCTNNEDWRTCREIYNFQTDNSARQQAISPQVAQTMTSMLRGVISNGTGRAASVGLGEAGKTGTTDRAVDLWFIGYIPRKHLATGVWLGNDDNSATKGSSGQAAALWGNYHRP